MSDIDARVAECMDKATSFGAQVRGFELGLVSDRHVDAARGALESTIRRHLEELAAKVAEMERDAGRLNWAEEHALAIDLVADPDNFVQVWHGTNPAKCARGRSIRAAIDAAKGKEER